jgi:hypothetical protein
LDLRLLGRRVRVTASDAAFITDVARCFDGACPPDASVAVNLHVHAEEVSQSATGSGSARTLRTEPPNALDENGLLGPQTPAMLAGALSRWAAATTLHYSVFHAGAVARDEKAMLLPGSSRSGKTTLTAALLQRGFELLSDEVGALDHETGRLTPYPRALSIRNDSFPLLSLPEDLGAELGSRDGRFVSVRELGARRAEGDADLALVIEPSVEPGAAPRLERLRPGLAAMTLIQVSCTFRAFKEAELDRVIGLARRVPCYQLTLSALGPALDLILSAFGDATKTAKGE